MHTEPLHIDIERVVRAGPLSPSTFLKKVFLLCSLVGIVGFVLQALLSTEPSRVWSTYFVNVLFWMGLAAGGVMTSVIFQIVRATWSIPIRRIGEANVAFLPVALALFFISYLGKEHVFAWGAGEFWGSHGRDSWMAPWFVYLRVGGILAILFCLMWKFVRLALRADVGYAREVVGVSESSAVHDEKHSLWRGLGYRLITTNWLGSQVESKKTHVTMTYLAPVVVAVYAVAFTVLATEMIGGAEGVWYSNMLGGFVFLGNIYIAWAMILMTAILLAKYRPEYNIVLTKRQLWDLGMLLFGFCMLWGYTFFSQFLPQWYANLPEVTGWLYLRTRAYPWKDLSWIVFAITFIIPFILLLSEDLKRTPRAVFCVCILVVVGVWLDRYVLMVPNLYKDTIPLGFGDLVTTLGFFGLYGLSVQRFLSIYPFVAVGSPLTRNSIDW